MRGAVSTTAISRTLWVAFAAVVGAVFRPAGWDTLASAAVAAGAAVLTLGAEFLLPVSTQTLLGAWLGASIGLPLALLVERGWPNGGFPPLLAFLFPVYLGLRAGTQWTGWTNSSAPVLPEARRGPVRILDTSVIIDGRIAEIAETGFLDGTFAIPRFVLNELQQVADSADPLKRTRGRRGLDVLQKIQNSQRIVVEIIDDDSQTREVDRKLIEVAKARRAALVTNDFNLNKVASLEGVAVLNVNELAGAMRPVVLPGEQMRVLVSREGKESGQGVAYLDDGTMVVIENGRRVITKTVDVTVTSVLQTAAGKMIFARYDDRAQGQWEREHAPARATAS